MLCSSSAVLKSLYGVGSVFLLFFELVQGSKNQWCSSFKAFFVFFVEGVQKGNNTVEYKICTLLQFTNVLFSRIYFYFIR